MTGPNENLRKAAVLMRSVDGDTAATLLAQLSPAEAAAVRDAMRALGPIDPDEQSEVLSAMRTGSAAATAPVAGGVELTLSSHDALSLAADNAQPGRSKAGRFDFLESAPINSLVPYLSREHAQTIAVVLAHLAPTRAAAVLAALSEKTQAEVVDRLSALGETDAESVMAVERELAAWVTKRATGRSAGRGAAVASIMAAADAKTRDSIMKNVKAHKADLAQEIAAVEKVREARPEKTAKAIDVPSIKSIRPQALDISAAGPYDSTPQRPSRPLQSAPLPHITFDQLIDLDARTLATVLAKTDADLLTLALVGSREALIDRICEQMPKRTARAFRRELLRVRPTRLSDVEAAQRAVAGVASQVLAGRRPSFAALSC